MNEKLIEALRFSDDERRGARAERIEWLSANMREAPAAVIGRLGEVALHSEAPYCYIGGHFIATVVVATAYVEQQVVQTLIDRGITTKEKLRISDALTLARENKVFDDALLDACVALAERRNSYSHLRLPTNPESFSHRFMTRKVHPDVIRAEDAQEALKVMDAMFHATLG